MDIAWSAIMERVPLMGDPARYRHIMHTLIWEGKMPELTPEERKAVKEREMKEARASMGGGATGTDREKLAALREMSEKLRAQKQAEENN